MPNPFSPAAQDLSSVAEDKPTLAQARVSAGRGKSRFAGQKNNNGQSNKLVQFCDFVIRWSVYLAVFLIPVWFLPLTLDALEINKQTMLVVLAIIALMAWFGRMMALRQVEFKRGVLNLIVLLYLVGYGIISWFSDDRYQSFVGTSGLQQFSFLTMLAGVIMYFVISNNIRDLKFVRNIIYFFVGSSALTALYGIFQIIGVYPLWWADFTKSVTFNSIGTIYALSIFLTVSYVLINALMLVMAGGNEVFMPRGKWGLVAKIGLIAAAVIELLALIILDFWIAWILLIIGAVLILAFAIIRAGEFKPGASFMLPMLTLVIAILLLIVNLPLSLSLPAEISPSTGASFSIAKSALQESPLVGSGPGTFGYDYSQYHSEGVNQTVFWNVVFDRANSHVLTLLATTGLIGVVLWLVLVIVAIVRSVINLFKDKRAEIWRYILVIGSVFILAVVAKFLYSSNFATEFTFWMILGVLGALISRDWFRAEFKVSPRAALIMSFVFILLIVTSVSAVYLVGQRYYAEAVFAKAVRMDQNRESIDDVLSQVNLASRLNKYEDTYLRNLSAAVLAKFNLEISQEVAQDRAQYVQALINDMIAIARAATETNPANVSNWYNLGSIYYSLMPYVQGAGDFAVEGYEKAIELAPVSPVYYTELAKVYISTADLASPLTQSEDQNKAAEAKTLVEESLAKAEQNLNKAIENKLDYAPAHYQLALVYDRQGRLEDAIKKMEQVAQADPQDVGVAFQIGLLYLRNDENEKAQNALEWAIQLVPSYSNARWFLATVYENQGNVTGAIEQVEKVLELNPDNQTVQQRLDNLKEFGTSQPPSIPEPVDGQSPGTTQVQTQRSTSPSTEEPAPVE